MTADESFERLTEALVGLRYQSEVMGFTTTLAQT